MKTLEGWIQMIDSLFIRQLNVSAPLLARSARPAVFASWTHQVELFADFRETESTHAAVKFAPSRPRVPSDNLAKQELAPALPGWVGFGVCLFS